MSTLHKIVALAGGLWVLVAPAAFSDDGGEAVSRHVLLVSIDGMHALDFHNCASANTCPNLAALAGTLADRVRRVGLSPRQIVVECTEQQAIADVPSLKKQVRALRRLGFGFAIDDAGAGYTAIAFPGSRTELVPSTRRAMKSIKPC